MHTLTNPSPRERSSQTMISRFQVSGAGSRFSLCRAVLIKTWQSCCLESTCACDPLYSECYLWTHTGSTHTHTNPHFMLHTYNTLWMVMDQALWLEFTGWWINRLMTLRERDLERGDKKSERERERKRGGERWGDSEDRERKKNLPLWLTSLSLFRKHLFALITAVKHQSLKILIFECIKEVIMSNGCWRRWVVH